MTKAEIVFKDELDYIGSKSVRDIVVKCFDKLAADYFWDFSASSSHLHHPEVCNGKHGIVIHTKLCVWWGRKLAESFNTVDLDIAIAALLLHDIQKFGKILTADDKPSLASYTSTHGPMTAVQIMSLYRDLNVHKEVAETITYISACVAMHMGKWTDPCMAEYWKDKLDDMESYSRQKQDCDIEMASVVVSMADYAASRQVDKKFKEFDNYEFPEV